MTTFGYFLSSEEHGPRELVRQARLAERAGFEALWISDHYHPWVDEQGQSPFVWTVIGALAEATSLPITTAVTCPLVRVHPAVVAQAAATSAVITEGRFRLGVGTGEALNEHITDSRWPPAAERLEMLEEAIGLMRELWSGELVTHRGRHYSVDTARVYTRPDTPPPVYISGFGPKAVDLAGRVGDGYILTGPSAELIEKFHESGGQGKPVQGGLKVCYDEDAGRARKTVHRLWPNQGITGEASQILPLPRHFEQLAEIVTEEQATAASPCGPDPEEHAEAIRKYVDAGFDEVYVNQIGPNQEAFFEFYAREVLPRLR
ncbi:LLM class F420-dependent oxidoreductase [Sphaerisporangium siamense]|uniref:G6PDH family F420-dependent oxidoreductase n=1 Tax=Sphaerisporangium siamense TaxID=795645 RepID=A0A7W7GG54_9ACTN|nr:LLM class F420-dependent oxidoreductase [Sphaerisporangium siamense]MBB4705731.1 G6PDH family F420-dependent oxidoreductase [Sphaerisporangium siamense]GII82883.1 LLM class F420-dependent oxidoreductase [Sphaerisporangium siamense]